MTRWPRVVAAGLAFGLAAYALTREAPRVLSAPPEPPFRFVDVAAKAGLTRVLLSGRPDKDHLLDSSGGGVAFLDYDKDGRLDVYLVNGWRLQDGRVVERGRNAPYPGVADSTFPDGTGEAGDGS